MDTMDLLSHLEDIKFANDVDVPSTSFNDMLEKNLPECSPNRQDFTLVQQKPKP